MNELILLGLCLLCCAAAAGQSVCGNDGNEPVSDGRDCYGYPLPLSNLNEHSRDTDAYNDHFSEDASLNDGGTTSFIERLLLFPVCLLEDQCYKLAKGADAGDGDITVTVSQMCENKDDYCVLEYVIAAGQRYLRNMKTWIEEMCSMYGSGNAEETESLENASTWSIVVQMFRDMTWTLIRYAVVAVIVMSFFPSSRQMGRYRRKTLRSMKQLIDCPTPTTESEETIQPSLNPVADNSSTNAVFMMLGSVFDSLRPDTSQNPTPVTEGMLKEHFPMCEFFDSQICNCGGKLVIKQPANHLKHYKMCEFFDLLPCNCGGVIKSAISTDYQNSAEISQNDIDSEHAEYVSATDQSDGGISETDVLSRDITLAMEAGERFPHWVQVAFKHYHMHDSKVLTCTRKSCENNDETTTNMSVCEDENRDNSNAAPLNISETASEVSTEPVNDSTETYGHLEQDSSRKVAVVCGKQFGQEDDRRKVRFAAYDLFEQEECDFEEREDISGYSYSTDSEDELFSKHIEDCFSSEIGPPSLNSSFKEDSPYLTANTVGSADLRDRGDGAVYSTLTRRYPYIEEGLSDLSADMSRRSSKGSILDVSDINSSMSFTEGEGVLQVATLLALQSLWRLAKWVWQHRQADSSCDEVAVEEKSCGLYVIRQKNKTKGTQSPVMHSLYKRSSENTGELNENNSNNTETMLHYEMISTVSTRKVLKTSTAKKTNAHGNCYTLSTQWSHSSHRQLMTYNDIELEKHPNFDCQSEPEIKDVNPNCNNNARYSKRKRDNLKRQSDSDSKADCEDCDCLDDTVRKRGRVVYKTRKTFDVCHKNKCEKSDSSERSHASNIVLRGRIARTKRRMSKQCSTLSTNKQKRRKYARSSKNLSAHAGSRSNDLQDSIDRISRDLSKASVSDNKIAYVGDTSDEFADESASSSDEKSSIERALFKMKEEIFALSKTPLQCDDSGNLGNSSTSDKKACTCIQCNPTQQKQFKGLLGKLRSRRCNVWELRDYMHINKDDNKTKMLAWAWSCVEK